MPAYQTFLANDYSVVLEYRCNEASGALANTGSAGATYNLTAAGTPTYRFANGNEYEADSNEYVIDLTGGTSDDAFYNNNPAWATGKTSGTLIFIFPAAYGATSDVLFSFSSAGANNHGFRVWNDNGEIAVVGYNATGTIQYQWRQSLNDSIPSNDVSSHILVIAQPADGNGLKVWLNGINQNISESVNSGPDFDFWVGDCTGADGFAIGGQIFWVGGSFSSVTNEWDGQIEYMAYVDEVFTLADCRKLMRAYHGGLVTGSLGNSITVSGRNKFRRYWDNQQRGTVTEGRDLIEDMFINDASSANLYHAAVLNVGTDRVLNYSDDDEWGDYYEFSSRLQWNTSTYSMRISPNGSWLAINDLTSTTAETLMPIHKWNILGFWEDARSQFDPIPAGSTPQLGAQDFDNDTEYFIATGNNRYPIMWVWNSGTSNWDAQTDGQTYDTNPNGFSLGAAPYSIKFGRGIKKDYLAYGSNNSSGSGHNIYELNRGTNQLEVVSFTTRPNQDGFAVGISETRDHIAISQQSTTSTPSDTGASQLYMYKRTGAKQWTSDRLLLNNGVAHPDQTSDVTLIHDILFVGDDMYACLDRSAGSYKNLLHWRWNGTYYAAQSSITLTGDGVYFRRCFALGVTSDGKYLMMTTNNAGSGSGHPAILTFDRNVDTGALTERTSPYDFLTPQVIDSADSDWTGLNYRAITFRESLPIANP